MKALIDVFKMTELSADVRIKIITALGKAINFDLAANVTEELVKELVDALSAQTEHQEALIQEESKGYLRGLSDSKALALMRAQDAPPKRRIVQISGSEYRWALCDDGTTWMLKWVDQVLVWQQLPRIPQVTPP